MVIGITKASEPELQQLAMDLVVGHPWLHLKGALEGSRAARKGSLRSHPLHDALMDSVRCPLVTLKRIPVEAPDFLVTDPIGGFQDNAFINHVKAFGHQKKTV